MSFWGGRVPEDAIVFGAHLVGLHGGPPDPGRHAVHKPAARMLQPDLHPRSVRYGRLALRICTPVTPRSVLPHRLNSSAGPDSPQHLQNTHGFGSDALVELSSYE